MISTWAALAAATGAGATEGDAGGEAAGALVETVPFADVPADTTVCGGAAWASTPVPL